MRRWRSRYLSIVLYKFQFVSISNRIWRIQLYIWGSSFQVVLGSGIITCQVTVVFASQISTVCFLFGSGIRTSPIDKIKDFERVPITLLLRNKDSIVYLRFESLCLQYQNKKGILWGCPFHFGSGIRIRTLNDGVRGSQSFFKTAYLSHFSDFASLKNLYQLCIRNF